MFLSTTRSTCKASILGSSFSCPQHASVDVERLLIGNKCDCDTRRVISKERGQQLAASRGIPFLETSAKSDTNVYEVCKH